MQQKETYKAHNEAAVAKEAAKYTFMQRMLNHCPYEGHQRTVEALTKHALPSNTKRSLSSVLTDGITSSAIGDEDYLPLKLSKVVLKIWATCLDEKHYAPIYLLLDLIRFAIQLELAGRKSQLVEEAVPLCMRTVELVANSVARASLYPSFAASAEFQDFQSSVAAHLDVDEVLEFVRELCDAASLSSQYIQLFWQKMEFPSTILMLNKAHSISQITAFLQILAMSVLPTSFGPICVNSDDAAEGQEKQERATIDRLTGLLFEMPEVPKDEPAYTDVEIAELRIEILEVFKVLCLSDHGGLLLSQHRAAIGRLVRFLDGQVNRLYTIRPSLGLPSPSTSEQFLHSLTAQTINTVVRIIYHLLRTYDNKINLLQKLAVVKGGYHKFSVSMTRIAFSDKLVFEEGLDEEVVEAAHQILDSVLSPEEGEAIVRAMETPRGTKGSSTETNTQDTNDDESMEEDPR